MIAMDGNAIIYREKQLPILLRLFILFLGTGMAVVIPAPFIIHAEWSTPSPTLLLAIFCIAFPIAAGAFFVLIGLASATELRLDPMSGKAERTLRGPIVNRRDSFALSDVDPANVVMRDSEDGPFPILQLTLAGRKWIEIACFASRAEAQAWADAIDQICGGTQRL